MLREIAKNIWNRIQWKSREDDKDYMIPSIIFLRIGDYVLLEELKRDIRSLNVLRVKKDKKTKKGRNC